MVYKNRSQPQLTGSNTQQVIQNQNSATNPKSLTPNTSASSSTVDVSGWKTYRNEKYGFEFKYPGDGSYIIESGSYSEGGSAAPALSFATLGDPVSLYTALTQPKEGPISDPVTIAVYKRPTSTLVNWLSVAYGTDLSKVFNGGMEAALQKAENGKTGVLAFTESQQNGIVRDGVGRATVHDNLGYATFFSQPDIPYIYEISFWLANPGWESTPSTDQYIATYNNILSTFKFTN